MNSIEARVGDRDDPASSQTTARTTHSTSLRAGTVGVLGIVFFVFSTQAPLTGIAGASALAVGLGNGAGAPGAYLVVGLVIMLFAVGFVAMSRSVDTHGGFYAYVKAAFGRRLGGAAAWLAILTYVSVQAGMYGLYGASFSGLLGTMGISVPWWIPTLATVAFVHFMGTRNIELGAKVLAVLVGLETSVLLAFALKVVFTGGGPEGLNIAASFSPSAVITGAPGVAIMFAIASMFGFESTAIYSQEAKDPKRTVARATYLSVCLIAGFFAFVSWTIVSFYGASKVGDAAGSAIQSGDTTSFVFGALVETLGPWAGVTAQVLLLTSLLAGVMALHNSVNRYFHSLALHRSLPAVLARTNRHLAPSRAAIAQTALTVVLIVPFAIFGLDPVLTLFSWFSGLSVASLLVVYVLTSVAVVVFFRRNRSDGSIWKTLVSPAVSTVLLIGLLSQVVANFNQLIGGDETTAIVLLAVVPVFFILGIIFERKKVREELTPRL
ncbi:APC family permease [Sinomonas gamaensis]|uniref:APC family permease n=1 Tax=Sinomonas gamaensis TaxID=2565624 RepID=UPI0011092D43|nr:APC family permease [Sinomonas gamaensis]